MCSGTSWTYKVQARLLHSTVACKTGVPDTGDRRYNFQSATVPRLASACVKHACLPVDTVNTMAHMQLGQRRCQSRAHTLVYYLAHMLSVTCPCGLSHMPRLQVRHPHRLHGFKAGFLILPMGARESPSALRMMNRKEKALPTPLLHGRWN